MTSRRHDNGASAEFLRTLFNDLVKRADLDLEILVLRIYLERVIRNPDNEDEWKAELTPVEEFGDVPAHSRLFISATACTRGRQVHFLSNLYVNADRRIIVEATVPYEMPLESESEFKDRSRWEVALEHVERMAPIVARVLEWLFGGASGA